MIDEKAVVFFYRFIVTSALIAGALIGGGLVWLIS